MGEEVILAAGVGLTICEGDMSCMEVLTSGYIVGR
jgi:hypothetical protein